MCAISSSTSTFAISSPDEFLFWCVFFALDYTVTVIVPVNTTVTYDCCSLIIVLPNNDSSASSNSSVRAGVCLPQYSSRWHRRKNASSCARSAAEQKSDHAGEQYNSLVCTVDLKTSLIDAVGIPWLRSTRSRSAYEYSILEHDVCKLLTWSAAVNRWLITTPSCQNKDQPNFARCKGLKDGV